MILCVRIENMKRAIPARAFAMGLAICSFGKAPDCGAESYVFDAKHTEVRFAYTMGLALQKGRFSRVEGTMNFDDAAPDSSRVEARIMTASLSTDEPVIDNVLKGRDFFNTESQPEIKFKSGTVRMTSATAANMTGDITVNGITKPITLKVTMQSGENPALRYSAGARRFTAVGRIQRSAFNMTAYGSMVAEDVDIVIDALLRKLAKQPAK
jgi:polyisoprenoid-binding protein YceI